MSAILPGTSTTLPQLPSGWQLLSAAALADGSLALLATNVDLKHEWRRDSDGRVLGKPHEVAAGAQAQIWCFDGDSLLPGPSFVLEKPTLQIDRFDDGRWLVVARRTEGEPNARILAPDGPLVKRFMLGDGIEHVGVNRCGKIFVGWFDEGVFGNEQWRVSNEEWAPSSNGIALFSAEGDHEPDLTFPEIAGMPPADCYALNILDDSVWACTYTDFPILHLQPGHSARWWSNEVTGSTALAVSRGHALLAGGYNRDANRLALVALDGDGHGEAARIIGAWCMPLVPRLPRPNESPEVATWNPWQNLTLLAGRGDTIHLLQNGTWHRWRVSDALIAVSNE